MFWVRKEGRKSPFLLWDWASHAGFLCPTIVFLIRSEKPRSSAESSVPDHPRRGRGYHQVQFLRVFIFPTLVPGEAWWRSHLLDDVEKRRRNEESWQNSCHVEWTEAAQLLTHHGLPAPPHRHLLLWRRDTVTPRPPKAVLKPGAGPQMFSWHRAPMGHLPEGSSIKKRDLSEIQ